MTTNFPMVMCGAGAVTPAGPDTDSLFQRRTWPKVRAFPLGAPSAAVEVLRVDLSNESLKQRMLVPRLRRATSLSCYMAEAAAQAWKAAGEVEPSSVGIVSVTSGGPLIYSRRFFDSFSQKGRKFASPAIFPETVFNASASHVASMLGIEGACYTLVGDASAFVTALEIAAVWLKRSEVSHVLVVASEEIDEVMLNAYRLVGWTRKRSPGLFSEGAGAIMLRRPCKGDDRMLVGIADTVGFRNPTTALEAAERCLKTFPAGIPVFPTASLPWQVSLEDKILARRPRCDCTTDLPLFGDAGSAGTAWHFIRAWAQLDRVQRLVMPVWGLNHQIGAVQLQHSHEDQQVR